MTINVYVVICWIVCLCVLGLLALACWFFEFIFDKLNWTGNLTGISNFFHSIKLVLVCFFILGVIIGGMSLIMFGFILIVTHISDFLFSLYTFLKS